MGCWLIERCRCYWHGHRDLAGAVCFGGVMPDGRIRELHFCLSCDSLVWTEHQPTTAEAHPTWNNLQN